MGSTTKIVNWAAAAAGALVLVTIFGLQPALAQKALRKKPPVSVVPPIAVLKTRYLLAAFTKADMADILENAPAAQLKRLSADPELRKKQLENIKQLLAVASEAVKSGIIDSVVIAELENIRLETTAGLYDRKVNKNKAGVPFSHVTEVRIKAFYSRPANVASFERFIDSKIVQAKKKGSISDAETISDADKAQAKEVFAKWSISDAEAKLKARQLGLKYARTATLKVRLQQAGYLTELYAQQVLAPKLLVTDQEVDEYIKSKPEFYVPQRAKASRILARARAGEDFAKLANEFSEDPGNKGADGAGQGGLYKDVGLGVMVKPFERGALALEPGQVAPELIESDFGYHIIKLERKGTTYDVRHILISTMIDNGQPLKRAIRERLENAKQEQLINEILKKNPVNVIDDFDVPAVPDVDTKAKIAN